MRVVWDRCALGGYEGFCCFALGLCGLLVDVWGEIALVSVYGLWEWLSTCLTCGKVARAWGRLCLHGSDSWTVVIEGMVGGRSGVVPLCDCDELTLSSGGHRSVGWTVVRL